MMQNVTTYPPPLSLGVPHPAWRPGQFDAYTQASNLHAMGGGFLFLEAPTGTGKSAIATALGARENVLVLVSTLGLLEQYVREYGFTGVRGRHTYPCADPDKATQWRTEFNEVPTAFDCHHPMMHRCPHAGECEYLQAKEAAKHARRTVITYKYAALSSWPKERKGILICDEGHGVAEEILAFSQTVISQWHVKQYGIPCPSTMFLWDIRAILDSRLETTLRDYLDKCIQATSYFAAVKERGPAEMRGYRFHTSLQKLLTLDLGMTDWFIEAGPTVLTARKQRVPGLVLRPLDAKPVAGMLWQNKQTIVLMSATIGNPFPLAEELGIERYERFSSPHLIPIEKRPVYSIFDERMTKHNLDTRPGLYRAQAIAISHFIRCHTPPEWRGIVLTTSYKKIRALREHLEVDGRLWNPPRRLDNTWVEVPKRIQAFLDDPRPGIIAVDTIQGWGTGLDLRGDLGRFVIVAGVQHANPADKYDQARKSRPGGMRYQRWLAYGGVMQACGRVTRGDRDENGEHLLNVAALADGGALTKTAKDYYSPWFLDAIAGLPE